MSVIHHDTVTMRMIRTWCPRCCHITDQTVERIAHAQVAIHWCHRCLIPREVAATPTSRVTGETKEADGHAAPDHG